MNDENDRYRQLVNAISDYAIYRLDTEGHVVSWNTGAERFKGYRPEEIIGSHFSRFYTPEDLAVDLPARALAIAASEGRFENEGWRVRKDGGRFWAHVIIDPIVTDSGDLVGYAKITRDLTERQQAAEALKRSQEQFQILVNGVTDYAIYMLDAGGRITNWNSGAERIKGYSPAEIVGDHFSRFYTEADRTAGVPARALATAAAVGRYENEGWRVRRDGSRFWAHVVIDAIRDEGGEIIGFAKVTRDITERRLAQKALDQAREALFQSQKFEAIGHLTGGVAHDFNNLLAAVLGSLELVRKRIAFDPRVSPLIDNAIMGAERGAALTQRMLAFARKQDLKLERVDVRGLVTGMHDFLTRTLGATIDVVIEAPDNLPGVMSDPCQLEAALLNLAVNARDAMPGGGSIRITAAVEPGRPGGSLLPGQYLRLAFTDTGEGMDAATVAKAADPFFTTKGVGKGTGLGLSMVHGLMLQCGGELKLKSQPGAGTTVELWLPVAGPENTAEDLGPALNKVSNRVGEMRVLAVDDDPLVLANTAALLEDLGCDVVTADSAHGALSLLESGERFDLLITDQIMPRMSGLELGALAKTVRPGLPIIVATGFADLGGQTLEWPRLQKPFTQAQLLEALSLVGGEVEGAD